MKIYIASDHAGFELKNNLVDFVKSLGFTIIDKGPFSYDETDDYPDFVSLAAQKVAENPGSFGIVLGKSGAGECIVANKIKGSNIVFYRVTDDGDIPFACMRNGEIFFEVDEKITNSPASPRVMLRMTPLSNLRIGSSKP